MKVNIPRGAESELANMLVECCSQEKTFMRYYGLLGQRFCMISSLYQEAFEHVSSGLALPQWWQSGWW